MDQRPDELTRFEWPEAKTRIAAWVDAAAWEGAGGAGRFHGMPHEGGARWHLEVPLVLGEPPAGEALGVWCQAMGERPGWHLVLLFQAGAAALALYEDDTLRHSKVFRRYVVRGRGRAQPLHLKTKGKSRYGSRLRLQQAKALRDDIVTWLRERAAETPDWQQLFLACPVRLWPDLYTGQVHPPFEQRDARIVRVPLDIATPGEASRERVRGFLGRGRLRVFRDGPAT